MNSKFVIALALLAAIIFAGCISQAEKTENAVDEIKEEKVLPPLPPPTPKEEITGSETRVAGNETIEKEPQTASLIPSPASPNPEVKQEWCIPTKINFLAEPHVSVHSPKLVYLENYAESQTPVLQTLEIENAFHLPIVGEFMTTTKIGVPRQHRVTGLMFQVRLAHSDGTIFYSKPFSVKEVFNVNDKTVFSVDNTFSVAKEGSTKISAKLKYKIDGTEQVQCTAESTVPFASSDSYLFPSFTDVKIEKATFSTTGGDRINAKANLSFSYSGIVPTSDELHFISLSDSSEKAYFISTNLKCEDNLCTDSLAGLINDQSKQVICSENSLVYLRVGLGRVQKNFKIKVDPNVFLKEFGGCQD